MVERVPLGDTRCGERGGEDDGVVVEEIVEDGGELRVDDLLLHLTIISAGVLAVS